jgi:hypothetical protein
MVGHALWLDECPEKFHEDDGKYLATLTNYFMVVYLDGILFFSKSWVEHLQHIQRVLHTLRKHKLYENLGKCSFGMNRVQYLGYIIDENGVHINSAKIWVIHDWPSPTTLTELWSFLGLANFYRRFMLGLSHVAWPLIQVTKGVGKERFVWFQS